MISGQLDKNVDESQKTVIIDEATVTISVFRSFFISALRAPRTATLSFLTLICELLQTIKIEDLNLFTSNSDQVILRKFTQGA